MTVKEESGSELGGAQILSLSTHDFLLQEVKSRGFNSVFENERKLFMVSEYRTESQVVIPDFLLRQQWSGFHKDTQEPFNSKLWVNEEG